MKKQNNILYLQKRGCNFWQGENLKSDCQNYRLTTKDYEIKGKDNKTYFLEFGLWRDRGHLRTHTKDGKRQLKKPVFEIDIKEGLAFGTAYENENGTFRNCELEKKIGELNLEYTQADILKAVNFFSAKKYNKIIIEE